MGRLVTNWVSAGDLRGPGEKQAILQVDGLTEILIMDWLTPFPTN
jgi:hypothetical protein